MVPCDDDVNARWALVTGPSHTGCMAIVEGATAAPSTGIGAIGAPASIRADSHVDTQLDVGGFQLTLKSAHPQILNHKVAANADVIKVFGTAPMQACLSALASSCSTYVLVGSGHELRVWTSLGGLLGAPQELHREYYVPELHVM